MARDTADSCAPIVVIWYYGHDAGGVLQAATSRWQGAAVPHGQQAWSQVAASLK